MKHETTKYNLLTKQENFLSSTKTFRGKKTNKVRQK